MSLLNVRLAVGTAVLGGLVVLSQACTITTSSGTLDGGDFPDFDSGNTVDSGADSTSPTDGGTTSDGSDSGLTACQSCLSHTCMAQYNVCVVTSECAAIYTCAIAPSCANNPSCVYACYNAHPAGQNEYQAFAQCNCNCKTECSLGSSCDPDPDAGTPDASVDACTACQTSKCGTEKAACAAGTACDIYTTCLTSCGADTACYAKCASDNPSGAAAAKAIGDCTAGNCSAQCGYSLRNASVRSMSL